jgi:ribosomal protein S18 acetylase RimI-like enzyme
VTTVTASLVAADQVAWLEAEFNDRWPWPRPSGFVARKLATRPHVVATDDAGRSLGHCHVRRSQHRRFSERKIPEIADLNVMPDCRRLGSATAMLDLAESVIAQTSEYAGIGVGVYDDYGPAQRLYTARGYVLDGTGAWSGRKRVRGGDVVAADDALVLYMAKRVRAG